MPNRARKYSGADNRLNREDWLRLSLDVLASRGLGAFTVQHLVDELGVSRGSFYWHFKDRNEFIHALLDYWHEIHTAPVPEMVSSIGGTARERFCYFLQHIHEHELTRFDMPIRSWAMQEPEVVKRLVRTDRFRLRFVESLFLEMGFTGGEAELRARSCVAYLIMGRELMEAAPSSKNAGQLEEMCNFFCCRT